MIELQTVTTKAKNPSTNEFQDVTWGGINVLSTSGTTNYNNLTNKPTINGVTVQGSLTTGDLLITAADVGALPSGTKYGADFALSIDSQTFVVTAQLKDQDGNNLGQAKTIDLPLETMVVSGSYDDTTQKIILTLKNGQTVEFSVADLVSGLQSEITLNNKLDADLVSDVSSENKFVTTAEKAAWNGKQSALTTEQLAAVNSGIDSVDVAQIETNKNNISTLNNEINYAVNTGAKNLLDYTFSINGNTSARTSNGVTFTINADRSISTSGTASSNVTAAWIQKDYVVPSEPVILSGCPAGGADNKYRIDILDGIPTGSVVAFDYGNGAVIKSSMFTNGIGIIRIRIEKDQNVDGLVFKPMIRPATITDPTYEPYALSNPVLTPAAIKAVDEGAKNLLDFEKWANAVSVVRGTKSVQGDAITITATEASCNTYWASADFPVDSRIPVTPGEKVVLSWKTDNTSGNEKGSVYIFGNGNASYLVYTSDISEVLEYTIPSGVSYITWRVGVNAAGDSIKYSKIMLCSAADYAISKAHVSYALSNPIITPALIKQVDEGAKNLLNLNLGFNTYTSKGITYKDNKDGTVNVSGTSSAGDSYINLYDRNADNLFGIQKGQTVVLRSTSDDVSINLIYKKSNGNYGLTVYGYKSSPGWFTVPSDFVGFLLRIGVPRNGTTVNEDVGGMICTAADYAVSPEVVPYALSNPVITPALIEQVDGGAKNLLNCSLTALKSDSYNSGGSYQFTWNGNVCTSARGVTFTINSDNSIDVVATSVTADVWFRLTQNFQYDVGSYVISGCPSGGSTTTYFIESDNLNARDTGNSIVINRSSAYTDNIFLVVKSGTTFTGTFKPMICTSADHAVSQKFVPYAMSNSELMEKKADFLKKTVVTSGNLDDISTNEFALYTTDVAGKPQSGYAFVRTSVYDSNAALQELTMLSGNSSGRAYVRVKYAGTWTAWKETTT